MTFADFAPAANIFISQFDEVDRPFMFIFPFDGKHLPLAPVDLSPGLHVIRCDAPSGKTKTDSIYIREGAGPDQRPHGETGEELRPSSAHPLSRAFPSSFHSSMTTQK